MSLADLAIYGSFGVILVGGLVNIGETAKSRNEVENQKPIYRDVNGDGIKDKIVKKLGEDNSPPFMPKNLGVIEEVFYGVKVNGKTIYLREDQLGENKSIYISSRKSVW